MAQVGTSVIATLQETPTSPSTDVLCFDAFVDSPCHAQWLQLALRCLPFEGLLFACAASLTALMSTAVEGCFAGSEALWRLDIPEMAHSVESIAATSANDLHFEETRRALARVTDLRTQMTAPELLLALLIAIWDRIFAEYPCRSL